MIQALFGVCMAFILVEVVNLKVYINKKPFNCGMCMSGWITLVLCLIDGSIVLWMFPAMVGYILLEKIFYKL